MKEKIQSPILIFSFILLISLSSLAAALIAEVVFGLEPCPLCIYQRIPFAVCALISLFGFAFRKQSAFAIYNTALCGLFFLINSIIAFYHTGVELKWWRSAIEGCLVPRFSEKPQSILENILSRPSARCDEIPWADPIFGLSMANYNVILCLGLCVLCFVSAAMQYRARSK